MESKIISTKIPMFVDREHDLCAKANCVVDSWYVKCNFVADGKNIGFEWHQSVNHGIKGNVQVEFLLMEDGQFTDRSVIDKVSKTSYASKETCRVCSSVGTFQGDSTGFTLKLQSKTEAVNVKLTPRPGHVLYNGANGLIPFGIGRSYQYSFPNMDIAGTVTIRGINYKVKDTIAWFDRQWGTVEKIDAELIKFLRKGDPVKVYRDECRWLWLGIVTDKEAGEAISLWDLYAFGRHNTFATARGANGEQINAEADVRYYDIWTSKVSGNRYPSKVEVDIPALQTSLTLTSLVPEPEFSHPGVATGCQMLCNVVGTNKNNPVQQALILEMIGSICK